MKHRGDLGELVSWLGGPEGMVHKHLSAGVSREWGHSLWKGHPPEGGGTHMSQQRLHD